MLAHQLAHQAIVTNVMVHAGNQVWPTIGRVLSGAAAAGSAGAALLGLRNRARLQEIHVLVNGNLSTALEDVVRVGAELTRIELERDRAKADLAKIGNRAADKTIIPPGAVP